MKTEATVKVNHSLHSTMQGRRTARTTLVLILIYNTFTTEIQAEILSAETNNLSGQQVAQSSNVAVKSTKGQSNNIQAQSTPDTTDLEDNELQQSTNERTLSMMNTVMETCETETCDINGSLRKDADTFDSKLNMETNTETSTQGPKMNPDMKLQKEQFVLYQCHAHCAGWGDRTRSIIIAYLIALVMGRSFRIDITDPCSLDGVLVPNKVDWARKLPKDISTVDVEQYLNKPPTKSFADIISEDKDLNKIFPEDVVIIKSPVATVEPFARNPRYHRFLKSLGYDMLRFTQRRMYAVFYDEIFKLSPKLQFELDTFISKSKLKEGGQLMCAQLRMGAPYIEGDMKFNDIEDLPVVWDYIKQKMTPNTTIFITSDSNEVRQQAREIFSDRWIDHEGFSSHIGSGVREIRCKGQRKTILDFHSLALCDSLIVSTGTYGQLAAYRRQQGFKDFHIFDKRKIH